VNRGEGRPDESQAERERRRRLEAALDRALPDDTADETEEACGERTSPTRDDDWYHGEKPPHHG
jgi:hypothetical protein